MVKILAVKFGRGVWLVMLSFAAPSAPNRPRITEGGDVGEIWEPSPGNEFPRFSLIFVASISRELFIISKTEVNL